MKALMKYLMKAGHTGLGMASKASKNKDVKSAIFGALAGAGASEIMEDDEDEEMDMPKKKKKRAYEED